jgi:hypothetical protein
MSTKPRRPKGLPIYAWRFMRFSVPNAVRAQELALFAAEFREFTTAFGVRAARLWAWRTAVISAYYRISHAGGRAAQLCRSYAEQGVSYKPKRPKGCPLVAWRLLRWSFRKAVRTEGLSELGSEFDKIKEDSGVHAARAWARQQAAENPYHRIPRPIRRLVWLLFRQY